MANDLYRMYDEMIQGYKTNNDGLFEHGVICWMDLNPENPFPEGSDAYELFFQTQLHYKSWRLGSADYKSKRRRMLAAARDLCALYPKRPYKFDKKADAEDKALKAAEEEARIKTEEAAQKAAIQAEAERIVREEEEARLKAERAEKARVEWEKAEAEAKAEEQRKTEMLKAAVEAERAKVKLEKTEYVLGVVPETGLIEETVPPEPEKQTGFFARLRDRFGKKASE